MASKYANQKAEARDKLLAFAVSRRPVDPEKQRVKLGKLARVFVDRLGHPHGRDFELAGFIVRDLELEGLIRRSAGRYSLTFRPVGDLVAKLWEVAPAHCELLNLERSRSGDVGTTSSGLPQPDTEHPADQSQRHDKREDFPSADCDQVSDREVER